MTLDSRRKGADGERQAIAILRDHLGYDTYRLRTPGEAADRGDLGGLPDTTLEVKHCKTLDVLAWIRQCEAAQTRNRHTHGATLVRRPGGHWFVALSVEQFAALWREATS